MNTRSSKIELEPVDPEIKATYKYNASRRNAKMGDITPQANLAQQLQLQHQEIEMLQRLIEQQWAKIE